MGAQDRGPLEGFAGKVPEPVDLLEAVEAVGGGGGGLAGDMAGLPGYPGWTGGAGLERGLRGRLFRAGQKGGRGVGPTKRGKGTKFVVVVDGQGVPIGDHLDSASPAEVKLVEKALAQIRVPRAGPGRPRQRPERLIADRAYDSDPLRARLKRRGIDLIVPHRRGRVRPPTQDCRKLRRYRRRWIVERTIGWILNFRRLVVRWERSLTMYGAFFHVALMMIVLRRL